MRKLMFALAIVSGFSFPFAIPANAGQFCTTQCMAGMCTTICN